MAGFFNDTTKLDQLAEAIVPPVPSGASEEQIKARAEAVENVKNYNALVMQFIKDELNGVFSAGVAIPQDGGTALQTAWKTATTG